MQFLSFLPTRTTDFVQTTDCYNTPYIYKYIFWFIIIIRVTVYRVIGRYLRTSRRYTLSTCTLLFVCCLFFFSPTSLREDFLADIIQNIDPGMQWRRAKRVPRDGFNKTINTRELGIRGMFGTSFGENPEYRIVVGRSPPLPRGKSNPLLCFSAAQKERFYGISRIYTHKHIHNTHN